MRRALVLAAMCGAAGCGDDRSVLEVFEPRSGTRLSIEQYQFDDGTRLVEPGAFYDRRLHARCTPKTWIDGVVRCVPDAEAALYRDAACTMPIGIGSAIKFPTHFIATERRDGGTLPARIFAAAAPTDAVTQAFYRADGECRPMPIGTEGTRFWNVGEEVDGTTLVPITDDEIGDDRLGLAVRRSQDGALVPLGFRDRELGVACAPVPRGDNDTLGVCEPLEAPFATLFADPTCGEPAILAGAPDTPSIATTRASTGCLAYHEVVPSPLARAYRREGSACIAVSSTLTAHALGAVIDLAPVTRTPDALEGRRVQRILASDGTHNVYADRLFDTATRAECRLAKHGDTLRCLPPALAPIVELFEPGCMQPLVVAVVPQRPCEPIVFAARDASEGYELRAIGEVLDRTAYVSAPNGCQPYVPDVDTELHAVGPALPDDVFISAVPFGAR